MYQLSILLPSAHAEKRERFIKNLFETISDYSQIELVICLDEDNEHPAGTVVKGKAVGLKGETIDSVVTYAKASRARGTFFNAAWKASSGRFLLMANDDILFRTKGWDKMIPYDDYPDDLVVFGFKDGSFNETFFCHPVWSRKAMMIDGGRLFEPFYQITKCDNTIWDIHPASRRAYLPNIEIDHKQDPYGPEWIPIYEEDNKLYIENYSNRNKVKRAIETMLGISDNKIMIGIPTAEYSRRADFYDWLDNLELPANTIKIKVHGQSIAENRNRVVEQALIHNCSHIFYLDDDVICKPDTVYRLLAHDKDIVCALQLNRCFPHLPLIFGDWMEDVRKFKQWSVSELNGGGLWPIKAAGLGAALIKTEVFKKLEAPWFRLGEINKFSLTEDTGFFLRANQVGVESYCDLDCTVGHISSMIIRPIRREVGWTVDYDTNGKGTVSFVPMMAQNA